MEDAFSLVVNLWPRSQSRHFPYLFNGCLMAWNELCQQINRIDWCSNRFNTQFSILKTCHHHELWMSHLANHVCFEPKKTVLTIDLQSSLVITRPSIWKSNTFVSTLILMPSNWWLSVFYYIGIFLWESINSFSQFTCSRCIARYAALDALIKLNEMTHSQNDMHACMHSFFFLGRFHFHKLFSF